MGSPFEAARSPTPLALASPSVLLLPSFPPFFSRPPPPHRNLSMLCTSVDLGTAPITVSIFCPPLKIMMVGMLRMPNSVATPGDSSVLLLIVVVLVLFGGSMESGGREFGAGRG